MTEASYVVGIDTGGTFTDITVLDAGTGALQLNKSATTPADFSRGVLDAVGVMAAQMGLTPRELLRRTVAFKHGTTVGTNALITRRGARVGFITTRGFEDTTLIMRGVGRVDGLSEDEIKHMAFVTKPEPLVPHSRIRGVTERIDFQGKVVCPLNEAEAREAIRSLVEAEHVEAIAVSLLFGWVNPIHEARIRDLIAQLYPERPLFTSFASELVPVVREYGRANTVIINCFLGTTMERYLNALERRLAEEGFAGSFLVMQANGGIASRREVSPIGTLNSGPAGGVIGCKHLADHLGHPNVICTDMGGTSFDVSLITDGFWSYAREPIVNRFRVIQPMIDIESIGAGGGTIARIDETTGGLLVGPDSAGAAPGPVCYGAGGQQPTVTDADLILGYIDPDYFLGGRTRLDRAAAEAAIEERIARPLGIRAVQAAAGIYDIINAKMSDLIRKQVVRAGHVPEEYVIYAFGGAGPVHCAAYAAELGVRRVYVFPMSAVFSAFGIASADILHTAVSSFRFFMPADPAELNDRIARVEERLYTEMAREGFRRDQVEFRRTFDLRYRRQMSELSVSVPVKVYNAADIQAIMDAFERRYEEVYGAGSAYRDAGIELISFAIDALGRTTKPGLPRYAPAPSPDPLPARKGTRRAWFTGRDPGWAEAAVYDYERLAPGHAIAGPAIIETPITTIVLPPATRADVDVYRNVVIDLAP